MVLQNPASVSEGTLRRLGLGTGKGEPKESESSEPCRALGSRRRLGGSAGAGMDARGASGGGRARAGRARAGVGEAMGDSETTESGVSALRTRVSEERRVCRGNTELRNRLRSLGQESPSSGVSSPRFKASKSGVSVPEGTDAWLLVRNFIQAGIIGMYSR